ncbi:hypothetical protein D3C72_2313060 [compost metagenome]
MAVETDDVGQHGFGEHRRAAGFFLENDLQQDAAREVVSGLGVAHHQLLVGHDQRLDFRQRDVGRGVRVVEPAVRVLLDDARPGLGGGVRCLVLLHG